MRWLSCILIACAGALPHAQADQVTARVTGGPHDAYFAIDFHNRDGLIAGLDGETLVSKDGGQTWTLGERIGQGSAILGVALAERHAVAVGQLGQAWVRGETDWQPVETGSEERWMNVDLADDGLTVAVGGFGALAVSEDGGQTWWQPELDWEALIDDWVEPHLFDVSVTGGRITIVGEFGLVLQSLDRGLTWQVRSRREESLFALTLMPDGTGYATGQAGVVLQTVDGGETWKECATPGDGNFYGVAAKGQSVAVVGMRTAWTSQDGCQSFRAVDDPQTDTGWLQAVVPAQAESGFLAIGGQGRVLKLEAAP